MTIFFLLTLAFFACEEHRTAHKHCSASDRAMGSQRKSLQYEFVLNTNYFVLRTQNHLCWEQIMVQQQQKSTNSENKFAALLFEEFSLIYKKS